MYWSIFHHHNFHTFLSVLQAKTESWQIVIYIILYPDMKN